jgi:hypothetical protein
VGCSLSHGSALAIMSGRHGPNSIIPNSSQGQHWDLCHMVGLAEATVELTGQPPQTATILLNMLAGGCQEDIGMSKGPLLVSWLSFPLSAHAPWVTVCTHSFQDPEVLLQSTRSQNAPAPLPPHASPRSHFWILKLIHIIQQLSRGPHQISCQKLKWKKVVLSLA